MTDCKNCNNSFEVGDFDRDFYKKVDVPEPTFCPDCRLQRRLSLRNERYLSKNKCSKCKKDIITFFREKEEFPIYCHDCWWGDDWDPLSYGQDFDFSRPFFEQFHELMMKVPKAGLLVFECENSEYNTLLAYCKNSYMCAGTYYSEDVYYMTKSQKCKDCSDGLTVDDCELVYYSVNSQNCYNCHHLINSKGCSDCAYLDACIGCKNCFMCSGLRNKEFNFKNQQYSKEDYEKLVNEKMQIDQNELMKEFQDFNQTIPKKYQNQINCENCSGNYLKNCNNVHESYDCIGVEDSKYMFGSVNVNDSMDLTNHDEKVELCYEICTGGDRNVNTKFSFCPVVSPECTYVYICLNISDCFGCDGLHKREQYCILNKKYSKEEYFELRDKIIEHMKKTGEYGEFFPSSLSLYPYNHCAAQDLFPLTKEQALEQGYKWQDKDPKEYRPATYKVPASIKEVPDSVVDEILACEDCEKNYKIQTQELFLHRKIGAPLSKKCSDCRQLEMQSWKNPRKLWKRDCDKCSKKIQSTYSTDRPEKVYCEQCYLKEVV
ncbi:hypothetical protein ACFLZH_01605 [Patescibacteria group bacterium]